MNRRVIASIVFAVVGVSVVGYYESSRYEGNVVQTSVVTGKITGVQSTGAAGNGLSIVTVSVGSASFTQPMSCGTVPYYVGETVLVADQLLRSGQHQYSSDVACNGGVSPYQSLISAQTVSSSTSCVNLQPGDFSNCPASGFP